MDNNVKKYIVPDLMMTLNNTLSSFNDNVELDGYYIGVVVDVDDPEKLGRCRIRVSNVFGDDISDDDLPWSIPESSFIGSLKGSFIVPPVDTLVYVRFDKGEIYLPVYGAKVLNTEQLPTNKDDDYPNNMIFFETEAGDSFEINKKQHTAKYTHSSGTTVKISATGSVSIDSVDEVNVTHVNNLFVDGSNVVPEGVGPLCALSSCLFTGAPHTGRTCLP